MKTLQALIDEVKQKDGFSEHVGMMLVHNGVVRAWSRNDHTPVTALQVHPDIERLHAICRELEQQPGIFAIAAESAAGILKPGDDVLYLVVAGDIREHVKATFSELLDRVKKEAVVKQEFSE